MLSLQDLLICKFPWIEQYKIKGKASSCLNNMIFFFSTYHTAWERLELALQLIDFVT